MPDRLRRVLAWVVPVALFGLIVLALPGLLDGNAPWAERPDEEGAAPRPPVVVLDSAAPLPPDVARVAGGAPGDGEDRDDDDDDDEDDEDDDDGERRDGERGEKKKGKGRGRR